MMRAYDSRSDRRATGDGRYQVVRTPGGWRVCVNGCVTRPFADRETARSLARTLQRERDGLIHATPRGGLQ